MGEHSDKKRGNVALVIFSALFFALLPSSIAYYYNITTQCQDTPCIIARPMNWTVLISNEGKQKIEYSKIEIIDAHNGSVLASFDGEFNPVSNDRGHPVVSNPLKVVRVILNGSVPKPHEGDLLSYYPCFTNIVSDTYVLAKYGEYEDHTCYYENQSLYAIGCTGNFHCPSDAQCKGNACKPLECGACEYISNHSCRSYPCCADTQCAYNAFCLGHACLPITCLETQYLFNRTCIDIKCADNEILLNRTCVTIDCEEAMHALNHTCVPLVCEEDEFSSNSTCRALGCSPYEYAKNHTCIPLDCPWNQGYMAHACVPLDCALWEDVDNHRCIDNRNLMLKFILEIAALALIIAFLALDIWKYRHRGHKEVPLRGKGGIRKTILGDELRTLQEKAKK